MCSGLLSFRSTREKSSRTHERNSNAMVQGGKGMPRRKDADEVFCGSCGNAIKQEAELCPECGTRNEQSTAGRRPPSGRARDDPFEDLAQSTGDDDLVAQLAPTLRGSVACFSSSVGLAHSPGVATLFAPSWAGVSSSPRGPSYCRSCATVSSRNYGTKGCRCRAEPSPPSS